MSRSPSKTRKTDRRRARPSGRTLARKKKPSSLRVHQPGTPRLARPARIGPVAAAPVTARELQILKRELERKSAGMRWNPDPEDVQKSVAQLVLTIVEFLRKLMERQAIRRMENKTLTPKEIEAVGLALMRLEETVREIGQKFGLSEEDLNLDLGPIKLI